MTNPLMHLVNMAGWFQQGSAGFHEKFILAYLLRTQLADPVFKRVSSMLSKRCIGGFRMHPPGIACRMTLSFLEDHHDY